MEYKNLTKNWTGEKLSNFSTDFTLWVLAVTHLGSRNYLRCWLGLLIFKFGNRSLFCLFCCLGCIGGMFSFSSSYSKLSPQPVHSHHSFQFIQLANGWQIVNVFITQDARWCKYMLPNSQKCWFHSLSYYPVFIAMALGWLILGAWRVRSSSVVLCISQQGMIGSARNVVDKENELHMSKKSFDFNEFSLSPMWQSVTLLKVNHCSQLLLVLPQSKVQSTLKSAISDFKKALNLKSL